MRKIHVTRQFFEASGPQGHFFEKTINPFFRQGLGECAYQISGLCRFSLVSEWDTNKDTHEYTHIRENIGKLLLSAPRGFD